MSDTVLKVEGISKKYCQSLKHTMIYGISDIASGFFRSTKNRLKLREGEFWALEDVSFELKRGDTFGIVGPNGSGKSTLLKLINGIFMPDKGEIEVFGKVGALIEVGAGFHPMLTGRENIYVNGSILGMSREDINKKFDEIVDFADIGDFIDSPVKHYSSGMYVRLGFSIAVHSSPDILLIDEVLAVGDAKFQRKCLERLSVLKKEGVAFILVSHNMQAVEGTTSTGLLLNKGRQESLGPIGKIVSQYDLLMRSGEFIPASEKESGPSQAGSLSLVHRYMGFGSEEIEVFEVRLMSSRGDCQVEFDSDEELQIKIELDIKTNIEAAKLWLTFINEEDVVCLGGRQDIDLKKGRRSLILKLDSIQLTTGRYKIAFHIFDTSFVHPYTQGQYGYFQVKKSIASPNPGKSSPYCWTDWTIT